MHGSKLRELRKQNGYTLQTLASELGVTHSTIATWERQEYPSLEAIEKCCKAFDIKLWEFFIEDPNDLKNYLPAGIKDYHISFIQGINSLPDEKRMTVLKAMQSLVETMLS